MTTHYHVRATRRDSRRAVTYPKRYPTMGLAVAKSAELTAGLIGKRRFAAAGPVPCRADPCNIH